MYCVQEKLCAQWKAKVPAGLDAGEGSRAGSPFRVRATDGSFCLEKRHGSLVCKSRTQSICDDDHNYFSVKATISLCPSTNLIRSVSVTDMETAWPDSKQRLWCLLNSLYNE